LDKRIEETAFYAGSLVGVSLDLDAAILHKPEYVRVLIGCRDVELIPDSAEGCLGDNFYDFFYEIDKIIVGGLPKNNTTITVGASSGAPSPKRARFEQRRTDTEESSEIQGGGSQTDSVRHGRTCDIISENVVAVTEDTYTEERDSDEESVEDRDLLVETMTKEHEAAMMADPPSPLNSWLVPCPILQNEHVSSPSLSVSLYSKASC
jgi:hypothetical protein